jgi:hypothetical protein
MIAKEKQYHSRRPMTVGAVKKEMERLKWG